jgi:hypothetical protein
LKQVALRGLSSEEEVAAQAKGEAMTPEQAIAYALEDESD